ncbi:MAG: methyltransferase domain-containing protein, partial [Nitrospinales bacterium]
TEKGFHVPDIQNFKNLDELLSSIDAQYHIHGLSSLQSLPKGSVNFLWSQAVLEHIRKNEFLETMRETRRILDPNGVCSHRIDLKDHLSCSKNNLRFKESIWESDFMANSGFYTNRIGYSEMIDYFRQAGFEVEVLNVERRWKTPPINPKKLDKKFASLPENELNISGFDVLLMPK